MKKQHFICLALASLCMIISGCSLMNNMGKQLRNPTPGEIEFFAQIGTGIALAEDKTPLNHAQDIKDFIDEAQQYLTNTGEVNFTILHRLVRDLRPEYQVLAATIVDIIERYVQQALGEILEKQKEAVALVSAGLRGAERAVDLHIQQLQSNN